MQEASDLASLKELLSKDKYDFRFDIGAPQGYPSLMTMHYVVLNVKAELDQLLCGACLLRFKCWNLSEHTLTRSGLCFYTVPPVHLHGAWSKLFHLLPAMTSAAGSSVRETEEATVS